MLTVSVWDKLAQFGMSGIIFGGFLLVLKWVFDVNGKLLTDMAEERRVSAELKKGFTENIKEISVATQAFQLTVEDCHRCQREEHREIIKSLGRINGYKD